ncbi:hypothetical protein BBK82_37945 [Lentzea guizhouensis]|uniref:Transcriptional regulator LacI/GalR-like sensor domain-containing protein n=1 Tax=Lentzea guizhouensis TaxID=1586287 RepID=A0A1B2HT69_9PSEU|nr:substrate-binding domain-containing protein [Lentzea guizhouensis]ANZ40911.1 hypothetical protein BBK82_37945 [Lentzea guizhouensis]
MVYAASADRGAKPIDLVLGDSEFPWFVELLAGLEKAAHELRWAMRLTMVHRRSTPDLRWLDALLERGSAGAILVRTRLNAYQHAVLAEERIPVVTVGSVDWSASAPSITTTAWHGVLGAVQHLTDLGHRRVALITGPDSSSATEEMVAGYREALRAERIPFTSALLRQGPASRTEGHRRGAELLALPQPPTAVVAGSDLQAVGVCEAATASGLRVPDDLSVIGFDDLPLASWTSPPLTTVRQPWREVGAAAVRMLNELAEGRVLGHPRVEFATSLVVRSSTRAL